MMLNNLTPFQRAQLFAYHLGGDFVYRNSKGNRWPATAWRKMVKTLIDKEYLIINKHEHLIVAPKVKEWFDNNHMNESLAPLE